MDSSRLIRCIVQDQGAVGKVVMLVLSNMARRVNGSGQLWIRIRISAQKSMWGFNHLPRRLGLVGHSGAKVKAMEKVRGM